MVKGLSIEWIWLEVLSFIRFFKSEELIFSERRQSHCSLCEPLYLEN
jgi:hypothetical protein